MTIVNTLQAAGLDEMQARLLQRLSRQTLIPAFLASIHGSNVYQVGEGWQRAILQADENIVEAHNATEFEGAVQNPHIHSIFVPNTASLTQEIAERVLKRNPLSKTIFWETKK